MKFKKKKEHVLTEKETKLLKEYKSGKVLKVDDGTDNLEYFRTLEDDKDGIE